MLEKVSWAALQSCVAGSWTAGIGDPTAAGWLTVAAYLVCAALALAVLRRVQDRAERRFWMFAVLVMAALAVNKQLDLQSALTALGRCVAQAQGWYDERRAFQREFIQGLLLVVAFGMALGLYLMRRHLRRNGLALLGLAVVAGFVAVRAAGFHHFESFINLKVLNLRYHVVLELSGLALIAVNALALLARRRV